MTETYLARLFRGLAEYLWKYVYKKSRNKHKMCRKTSFQNDPKKEKVGGGGEVSKFWIWYFSLR